MEESALRAVESWKDRDVIKFYEEYLELEFNSSIKLMLGEAKGLDLKHLEHLFHQMGSSLVSLAIYLPGTTYWKGCKAGEAIHKIIHSEIHKRRTEYEAGLSPLGNGGRLRIF